MGVRQLLNFIQKFVPNGYIDVSLYEVSEEFKKQNNNILPILLIDFNQFLRTIIKDYKELLCGIRHNKVKENLEKFFQDLSQIGEIIFFKDGPPTDVKLPKWIERQNERYKTSQIMIQKIYENYPINGIIKGEKDVPYPISYLEIVEELAQKYGKLKTSINHECDAELVQYACKNSRVLAILSDDSDFLIYPGNWRYFSLDAMNHETLKSKEYNREALRNYLGLNDHEMVILSTLNGNDLISFEETFEFHKSLRLKNRFDTSTRFSKLARYIKDRKLHSIECEDLNERISRVIFRNSSPNNVRRVKDSMGFYDVNFESLEVEDAILKFCLDNSFIFIYSILNYLPVKFTFHFFDPKRTDNFYERVNDLFKKQIGIILKEKPSQSYKIVSKIFHNDRQYTLMEVDRVLPTIDIPPLIELLNRPQYSEHDKIRFNLIKWLINEEKLANIDLDLIPKIILIDILTLTFMVYEGFINVTEADIILLTIKHVEDGSVPENLTAPNVMRPRAFLISYLFSHCFFQVSNCLEVTGLKNLVTLNKFDGVLFHNLYSKYENESSKIIDVLGDLIDHRLYGSL